MTNGSYTMQVENEMGVIVVFAQQAEEAGFEIVSIRAEFPDAIVKRGNQKYRAEFEYKAKNFLFHGHDPRACDLIICWENNFEESVLPVIALSHEGWQDTVIALPSEIERELSHWKYRALIAEYRLRKVEKRVSYGVSLPTPGWLTRIPDNLTEFRQLIDAGLVTLPSNLTGADLQRYIPAVGTDRTGRNWLEAIGYRQVDDGSIIDPVDIPGAADHRNGNGKVG